MFFLWKIVKRNLAVFPVFVKPVSLTCWLLATASVSCHFRHFRLEYTKNERTGGCDPSTMTSAWRNRRSALGLKGKLLL